jgi:hypothetical protein
MHCPRCQQQSSLRTFASLRKIAVEEGEAFSGAESGAAGGQGQLRETG